MPSVKFTHLQFYSHGIPAGTSARSFSGHSLEMCGPAFPLHPHTDLAGGLCHGILASSILYDPAGLCSTESLLPALLPSLTGANQTPDKGSVPVCPSFSPFLTLSHAGAGKASELGTSIHQEVKDRRQQRCTLKLTQIFHDGRGK